MQRIADSAGFRSAARLRDFLLFVTDLALSGRAAEISEQHIGHEVFHRPVDYDTASDNIVRVSARQLRIKLKEYTEREGDPDAWTIDIPKGAYVPVFSRRAAARDALREPGSAARWKITAAVCALLALAASAAYLHARFGIASRRTGESPLTNLIIRPGERTIVVLADSSMVLLHEVTGHLMTADEYAARQAPPPPEDPSLEILTRSILSQQLTSIADVEFALHLIRNRPDASDRIVVVHARNIGPRSLKEGNAILLGGSRSNPWAKLFEDRLNYRFDFSGERPSSRLVNTRPRPREPASYETERRHGIVAKSFARIALVPNLDNSGRVLLISGTTIEGTEAATEFFFGPHSTARLAQALGRAPSAGNGFEVLLETTAIDGTARSSRIVGARAIP
ncbi:MAG: hypothetical protein M1541_12180 [Acidobacteria bacterium]|nr:hypothetical protein [Acidobacteriota bacterium]